MKAQGKRVPATAVPIASCTREWDGALVEFFVLKQWRRSHDRVLDGSVTYRPVGAVARQVLWQGESSPNEQAARAAAMVTYRAMCKEPALDLIESPS